MLLSAGTGRSNHVIQCWRAVSSSLKRNSGGVSASEITPLLSVLSAHSAADMLNEPAAAAPAAAAHILSTSDSIGSSKVVLYDALRPNRSSIIRRIVSARLVELTLTV